MTRCVFNSGKQRRFMSKVQENLGLSWEKIGQLVKLSPHTLRDWKREKFLAKKEVLLQLSQLSNARLPTIIEERKEWWSAYQQASAGARARMKIYGPPGTPEGRRKGGLISQKKRRENPDFYRQLGCNVRNKFLQPKPSDKLAEFVGIMLGDGSITDNQIRVTLNNKNDVQYSKCVSNHIQELFGKKPSILPRKQKNARNVLLSGVNLVNYCLTIGLVKGNKIKAQVDIPEWIKKNKQYYLACIRGLFDTDGCLYTHIHWTKGILYRNLGLCFTSYSKPLLRSFYEGVRQLGFKASIRKSHVYMYSLEDIEEFLKVVKPRNIKQVEKLRYHISNPKRMN
jgi:hypothetical protein